MASRYPMCSAKSGSGNGFGRSFGYVKCFVKGSNKGVSTVSSLPYESSSLASFSSLRDIASFTLYSLLPILSNSSSYSPDRRSSFHVLSSFLVAWYAWYAFSFWILAASATSAAVTTPSPSKSIPEAALMALPALLRTREPPASISLAETFPSPSVSSDARKPTLFFSGSLFSSSVALASSCEARLARSIAASWRARSSSAFVANLGLAMASTLACSSSSFVLYLMTGIFAIVVCCRLCPASAASALCYSGQPLRPASALAR